MSLVDRRWVDWRWGCKTACWAKCSQRSWWGCWRRCWRRCWRTGWLQREWYRWDWSRLSGWSSRWSPCRMPRGWICGDEPSRFEGWRSARPISWRWGRKVGVRKNWRLRSWMNSNGRLRRRIKRRRNWNFIICNYFGFISSGNALGVNGFWRRR